jgi:tetratricopeptide (TPR) repeat protein
MASVLHEIAGNIYEISRRSLDPPFLVAAKLLETLLALPSIQRDRTELATAHFRLGLIYRNKAERDPETESLDSLNKAISHSRQAINYLDENDGYEVVSATMSLANCLSQRGSRLRALADVKEAIALLEGVQEVVKRDRPSAELIPHISISLGAAFLNLYHLEGGADAKRAELVDLALKAFRAAADASEYLFDAETWGAAKGNMGVVLALKSRDADLSSDRRRFLRTRAIAEYEAAAEVYPVVSFPTQFAQTQNGLGAVFLEEAIENFGQLKEAYLARCLHALAIAASILTEEDDPIQWAKIRMEMGDAYVLHARMEGVESSVEDYEEALSCFRDALPVLSEKGEDARLEACKLAIKKIEGELEGRD